MDIQEIDKKYGTPFYIYHKKTICEKYNNLKNSLFPNASLYYSMKANPLAEICSILNQMGAGIEVASLGELQIALQAGIKPENIVFTGPGKTEKELVYAIENNIKLINIDSIDEVKIINRVGNEKKKKVKVAVRVNPSLNYSNAKIKMTGVASQFGIEENELDKMLIVIKELDSIQIVGFQIYVGTQMLLASDILQNTEYAIKLFIEKAEKHGINLETVNVGGGFGIKYFNNENDLNLIELKEGMNILFSKYEGLLKNMEVIFESGRYIMADAGEFVTKVLYIKKSKDTKYVICDGGSNFHSSAAFLGRFVRNNFPMRCEPKRTSEMELANIVGPLCTPYDILGKNVMIDKKIKAGDYIVVEKSGAYGLSYSPIKFLHHELPKEIIESEEGYAVVDNCYF